MVFLQYVVAGESSAVHSGKTHVHILGNRKRKVAPLEITRFASIINCVLDFGQLRSSMRTKMKYTL